jgi:cellulose synthase/poly-beta-1,6-N-acetylglucosamine synthase-like glycosyltransferase
MDEITRYLLFDPVLQVLLLGLSLLYAVMICLFVRGWRRTPSFEEGCADPRERVTVIIPCHNEAPHLPALLEVLAGQEYPNTLLDIFLVDDHSTDGTWEVMEHLREEYDNIHLLRNEGRGKKEALLTAIQQSGTDWLITTDADARPAPGWISVMMAFRRHTGARFVAGPVELLPEKSIFSRLRALEFYSLTGAGLGAATTGHALYCNGASLGYERRLIMQDPDPMRKKISGGDDVFLLHTVKERTPGDIRFLKSRRAVVTVIEKEGLFSFFRQRRRWASKATAYRDRDTLLTASLVFLMNTGVLFTFFAGFFRWEWWLWLGLLWIMKSIPDFLLLKEVTAFYGQRQLLRLFPAAQLLYPFYLAGTGLAGIFSFSLREKGW